MFDLQKNQTLRNIHVMPGEIWSVAFSRDNQNSFISDYNGNIKMINWQTVANSEGDLSLPFFYKRPHHGATESIHLTKDEKYLVVGSYESVIIFDTATREITKEFYMGDYVRRINMIKNDTKAIIPEMNGTLSIIDLETMEISRIAKKVTDGKELSVITAV